MADTNTARQPWKVTLMCSDCGKSFEVAEKNVNPSVDVVMGGPDRTQRQRLLLVKFLADCPACHNMRLTDMNALTPYQRMVGRTHRQGQSLPEITTPPTGDKHESKSNS